MIKKFKEDIQKLYNQCNDKDIKQEIIGLYELAISEIECGESPEHEIELCMTEIRELLK